MTMSDGMMVRLEERGLDIELLDRLGFATENLRGGGERLAIPFTRSGKVVRRKYRRFDVAEGEQGKWLADKGGDRIAFNEDCLRDNTLIDQPVIITEGELDAVSAIQAGFPRTISVPDGAPPPGERDKADLDASAKWSWLREVMPMLSIERAPAGIIIASDGDENGAAMLQDLAIQLGRERCKFLTYPKGRKVRGSEDSPRERCKDLNEVLEDYGVKGVVETINRAAWLKIDGVFQMSELPPLPERTLWKPQRHPLFAENFRFRTGDVSVWTGIPSHGKSSLLNDLLSGISLDYGVVLAWASFEQLPQDDHKRALRAWHAGANHWALTAQQIAAADAWIESHHRFIVPSFDEDATLDWLLDKMAAAAIRAGAKIFVIDPWNEVEHCRERWESEHEYTGRALRLVKRFARAFQAHVAIVAHPTKIEKNQNGTWPIPNLYQVSGSSHWFNKVDQGVIVHRHDVETTHVKVAKSKYHEILGEPGTVAMQYSKSERRFAEWERVA